MTFSEMFERFSARSDHCRLQLRSSVILHAGRVGQIADRATDGGRQSGIGVNLQTNDLEFSFHFVR